MYERYRFPTKLIKNFKPAHQSVEGNRKILNDEKMKEQKIYDHFTKLNNIERDGLAFFQNGKELLKRTGNYKEEKIKYEIAVIVKNLKECAIWKKIKINDDKS